MRDTIRQVVTLEKAVCAVVFWGSSSQVKFLCAESQDLATFESESVDSCGVDYV